MSSSHNTTIHRILTALHPHLSESSIRTHTASVNSICTLTGIKCDPVVFCERSEEIHDAVMKRYPSATRKTYFQALTKFTAEHRQTEGFKRFDQQFKEDASLCKKASESQEAPAKYTDLVEQGASWQTILDTHQALERKYSDFLEEKELSPNERHNLQKYVLLSCFVLTEPRRSLDWVSFVLRDESKDNDNYLERDGDDYVLVFNVYKTEGKYGTQRLKIDPKLGQIIEKWRRHNPTKWFLLKRNHYPMDASGLCHFFYEIFNGRRITPNILRHMYLAQFQNQDQKMTEIAERMAHSVAQQHQYIYQQ